MSPLVIAAVALLLGAIVGSFAVFGAPIFFIPIVLAALLLIGTGEIRRRARRARSLGSLRDEASAEKVEFTDRDRRTLH